MSTKLERVRENRDAKFSRWSELSNEALRRKFDQQKAKAIGDFDPSIDRAVARADTKASRAWSVYQIALHQYILATRHKCIIAMGRK